LLTAQPDLDDDELAGVIAALKEKLDRDRYSRAPRLDPFRRALAKLDPKIDAETRTAEAVVAVGGANRRPAAVMDFRLGIPRSFGGRPGASFYVIWPSFLWCGRRVGYEKIRVRPGGIDLPISDVQAAPSNGV